MLIFAKGGKPENPEKNPRSKGENQQQTQFTQSPGIEPGATVVRGEHSHPYTTCASGLLEPDLKTYSTNNFYRPFAGNSKLEYKTIDYFYMRIALKREKLYCYVLHFRLQRVYSWENSHMADIEVLPFPIHNEFQISKL
jgi:hypothetical protein